VLIDHAAELACVGGAKRMQQPSRRIVEYGLGNVAQQRRAHGLRKKVDEARAG
jgi:hypothetical protein